MGTLSTHFLTFQPATQRPMSVWSAPSLLSQQSAETTTADPKYMCPAQTKQKQIWKLVNRIRNVPYRLAIMSHCYISNISEFLSWFCLECFFTGPSNKAVGVGQSESVWISCVCFLKKWIPCLFSWIPMVIFLKGIGWCRNLPWCITEQL